VALATRHGKARALATPLRRYVGLRLRTPRDLDTDSLGTFTGEIPRRGDALHAARAKARLALGVAGGELALASEGSFGPELGLGFVSIQQESLLWFDARRGMEIVEMLARPVQHLASMTCADFEQAMDLAHRAGFPEYGMVVRPNSGGRLLFKGLRTKPALQEAFARCIASSADGRVWIGNDLRAHQHPERMAAIARLGVRLAMRLNQLCSACDAPGWGLVERRGGLPCASCGTPTEELLEQIEGCSACGMRRAQPRADGRRTADPTFCAVCNP
jgi:hypothetical protein